ncbi:MAG: hypothetical protein QHH15_00235 [Candidatus Thermoplasmatota archaeon]|nr:hypothetical protein [Candidatus Thermoplasmatota archaeon]
MAKAFESSAFERTAVETLSYTGSGSSGSPYILYTLNDLAYIPTLGLDKYYKLGADIDASATANAGYNSGAGWTVISGTFTGDFNGDSKKITGLFINRPTTDSQAFFYQVNGTVHHVTFESVNITGQDYVGAVASRGDNGSQRFNYITVSGTIDGRTYIGGVVGNHLNGGATYCTVTATITGTGTQIGGIIGKHSEWGPNAVDNCSYDGTITGAGYVGGIIGYSLKTPITNCITDGDIYYSGDYVGGIVGYFDHNYNIDNCDTTMTFHMSGSRSYIGGICGYLVNGNIMNCSVDTGTISGNEYVGGLAGSRNGGNASNTLNSVDANITGVNYVGGYFGYWGQANSEGGSLNNCTYKGTITGTGFSIGGMVGRTNQYPNINNIDVTSDTVIVASATSDQVGGAVGFAYSLNISYVDVAINITGRDSVGGILGAGDISNFSFDHCTYAGTLTGRNYVGGILGSGGAGTPKIIQYCTTSGTITATGERIGGIGGSIGLNIDNCSSSMNITTTNDRVGGILGWTDTASLTITNTDFTGTVDGRSYIGGIAGVMDNGGGTGKIENCDVTTTEIHSTGTDIGGIIGWGAHYDIALCNFNGVINGVNNVGGIAGQYGYPYVTIQTSTVAGTINATGTGIGGVIGRIRYGTTITGITISSSTLTFNPSATSDYVGGLVGRDNEENYDQYIINCSVTLNITARDYVGGLVGSLRRVTFNGCSYTGTVSGRSYIGGIAGGWGYVSNFSFGTGNSANGTVTGTGVRIGGLVGYTPYGGTIPTGNTNNATVTGGASSDYVGGIIGYQCNNNNDLKITSVVNNGNVSGRDYIGGTVGTMSRGTITSPTNTGTVSGRHNIGGIVGYINGCMSVGNTAKITGCTHKVNVTGTGNGVGGILGSGYTGALNAILIIEKCRYKGTVSGANYVGGIVGRHYLHYSGSTITECFSQGTVTASATYAGGIAGYHYNAPIANCFSIASINATTNYAGGLIGYYNAGAGTYCYSKGAVTGASNVGGLIGAKNTATMTSGYWDTETSGQSSSALGTGKTTAEMKTEGTYTSWDFATPIWYIGCQNAGYPYLKNASLFDSYICNSGIASGEGIGSLKVLYEIIVTSILTGEAIGSIIVAEGSAEQDIILTALTSSEAIGGVKVVYNIKSSPISTSENIGNPDILLKILLQGIITGEVVGDTKLLMKIIGSAISSTEDIGSLKVLLGILVDAITSQESIGLPILLQDQLIYAESILSGEMVATPKVIMKLVMDSILSSELVNEPKVALKILIDAINSQEDIGLPILLQDQLIFAESILSGELFGDPKVAMKILMEGIFDGNIGEPKLIYQIVMDAIISQENIGLPLLMWDQFIDTTGILSEELFGLLLIYNFFHDSFASFDFKAPTTEFGLYAPFTTIQIVNEPMTIIDIID